jgi:predicted ferric reductase/Ca2+-binding EF-hand superfamily protein
MGNKPPGKRRSVSPLETVMERLDSHRDWSHGITAQAVQTALDLRSQFLAERVLVALGGDTRRFETAAEFIAVAQQLMSGPLSAKISYLFRLHDIDGDGWIGRDELERMIHITLAENDIRLPESEIDRLVTTLMSAGDADGDQRLSRADFAALLAEHPELQVRLSEYGVSLLRPGNRARRMTLPPGAPIGGWVRNGFVVALWLGAIVGLNMALFMDAVLKYQAAGASLALQIARGAGACLNFDAALIAVPMLRYTITRIRRSRVARLFPVDEAIDIHRLLGNVVVLLGIVHSAAHVVNAKAFDVASLVAWGRGSVAVATGFVLLILCSIIAAFSRNAVRRSGNFELFHLTHMSYFGIVALLFVHAPNYWMWGTVPWAWYLLERLLRLGRRRAPARVLAAHPLPSGVVRLDFERHPGFTYVPGDYVFLNVPSLTRHEWHPFTLTSAPEDPQRLSVHIRSLGNWSRAVLDAISKEFEAGRDPIVRVDGPYGSPSRHLFDTQHAVAVAAGIGVTPFASILRSLLLSRGRAGATLQKLHFIWLNRDQESFSWFRELLGEIETRDPTGVLEIHIFMTAGRTDMAGGVLDLAQHVLRGQQEGDFVTGLRAHTTFGAPDFDRLFESFYRTPHLPPPEVFFCGPESLGRSVARSARRLRLRFRFERF